MRDPQAIWLDDVVARAGFADADDFVRDYALKNYRLQQFYRAATKELLADVDDVTTLPKELRAALVARGVTFSSVEPVVVQQFERQADDEGPLPACATATKSKRC